MIGPTCELLGGIHHNVVLFLYHKLKQGLFLYLLAQSMRLFVHLSSSLFTLEV